MKYLQVPIAYEAYQIQEENNNLPGWLKKALRRADKIARRGEEFILWRPEGLQYAKPGDWILQSPYDELLVYKGINFHLFFTPLKEEEGTLI